MGVATLSLLLCTGLAGCGGADDTAAAAAAPTEDTSAASVAHARSDAAATTPADTAPVAVRDDERRRCREVEPDPRQPRDADRDENEDDLPPCIDGGAPAYRIDAIGDCIGPWQVCDASRPFTFNACGGTMTHTPDGPDGGRYVWNHSGVPGHGSYTLAGPQARRDAVYRGETCPPAMGCIRTPPGKATWTRIASCR